MDHGEANPRQKSGALEGLRIGVEVAAHEHRRPHLLQRGARRREHPKRKRRKAAACLEVHRHGEDFWASGQSHPTRQQPACEEDAALLLLRPQGPQSGNGLAYKDRHATRQASLLGLDGRRK